MPDHQDDRLRLEFNNWAEAGRGEGMEQEHLPIVLPLLGQMQLQAEDNVLDIGCGTGWLAQLIAEQVSEGRVVGVDVSDEMIRRARRHHVDLDNAMFVIGEASAIPWDASFFTHAVSVESAFYWPDPSKSLREVFRVLREGGTMWMLINYYRENPHSHHWGSVAQVPILLLSADEWSGIFRDAGFVDVAHTFIPDPTPAPEKYEGRWFRDAAQLRDFRQQGALLVRGTKPRR